MKSSRVHRAATGWLLVATWAPVVWSQVPAVKPCSEPQHRQFDFWLGDWNVHGPKGRLLGESRIEAIANGCALLENWSGTGGFAGKSLSSYDGSDRKWHQSWIGSDGLRLELAGNLVDGRMQLEGRQPDPAKPGAFSVQRISWSLNPDGSVHQLWQTSIDGGTTWNTAFDGTYLRRK